VFHHWLHLVLQATPTVTFTDLSTGEPTSWSWNFDDGFTSTLQNPTHTFATNGTYDVCLTATSILGSNTDCNTITIDSYLPPVADFSYTGDPEVFFTDLSLNDPTSWNWAFGDGFTSPEKNPVHTFAEDGSYYVCLTATNLLGSNTSCEFIEITGHPETPAADFHFQW
jgi:PKD repeat protein